MSINWSSAAALIATLLFFIAIYLLRTKARMGFTSSILASMLAGVGLGIMFSGHTGWIRPIGTIYISVLTAIVAPLILVSVLSSVTSLGSLRQLRGIGARSVFWLLVTTFFSIIIALALGLAFHVGRGANLSIDGINGEIYEKIRVSVSEVIVGLFPNNIIGDIAAGKIVPMIIFAILIAVSYVIVANRDREKVATFKQFVDAAREIVFTTVGFIIELTPYAVLALITSSVGTQISRSGMVYSLILLLVVSVFACAIEIWLVGGILVSLAAKLNPFRFFRRIIPAQIVAFSTQSSAGTLPVTVRVLQNNLGVGAEVANFTAPLGTTIGMPGCAGIWPVLVAIYGVNGLGISYELRDYVMLGLVSLLVSLGTAGVPGTATITAVTVLTAVGLPVEMVVLVVPIASIADTARTATNVSAAITASVIVARAEGDIDDAVFAAGKLRKR